MSGLYDLIDNSNKREVVEIGQWLLKKIISTIYKNGPYIIQPKQLNITFIEKYDKFIDKLISVSSKPTEFSEELINLQRHKHSHTCKKHVKDGIKCRFGIPYFPMRKTMILEPFSDDEKFTTKRT